MERIKSYPLHSSPLYKLRNRRRLGFFLNTEMDELESFASEKDKHYSPFQRDQKTILAPSHSIKKCLRRFHILLSRIETPDYLMSGKKGRDYISNAHFHVGKSRLLKLDIRRFFESTRRESVFQLFRNTLLQSEDVAWLLTDIVTYKSFLPRGAPSSPLLSFWVHKNEFDQINNYAHVRGLNFGLYVDDMGFSSNAYIPIELTEFVSNTLLQKSLRLSFSKRRYYRPGELKYMTGIAYDDFGRTFAANKLKRKIFLGIQDPNWLDTRANQIAGCLNAARRVEKNAFSTLKVN